MLFSGMTGPDVAAFDGDAARFICGLAIARYHPAIAIKQRRPSATGIRIHFFDRFVETSILSVVGGKPTCRRRAISAVDCGRFAGSFARHAATVSSQAGGSNAGSMLNSFRRSVIERG